jgi:hypothetical protein
MVGLIMKLSRILGLALLSAATACAVPAEASVTVTPDKVFSFSGQCTLDCTGEATAELTLDSSYNLGDPLSSSNFISFHYDGTDALAPFTFTVSDVVTYGGAISSVPGKNSVTLANAHGFGFISFNNPAGNWAVGFLSDAGIQGSYTATTVPEPGTWAMLLLGFAGLGLAGYRTSGKGVLVARLNSRCDALN